MKSFWILLISVLIFSCQEKENELKGKIDYLGPVLEADDINVVHSDSGYVRIKMTTAKQLRYATGEEFYPKPVYITFVDKKTGVEYSRVRGDSARYRKSENIYQMQGNVLVNNTRENQSLATEELFWNPGTGKIYSEKKVVIKTPKENFTALGGMDAEQDFSRYTLRKSRGTVMVDSIRTIVDTTGH